VAINPGTRHRPGASCSAKQQPEAGTDGMHNRTAIGLPVTGIFAMASKKRYPTFSRAQMRIGFI